MNITEDIKNKINLDKTVFRLTLMDVISVLEDMQCINYLTEEDIVKILEYFNNNKFFIYDWHDYVYDTLLNLIEDIRRKRNEV